MTKSILITTALILVSLVFFGCAGGLEIGIDMDSKWAVIPKTEDFQYFAPGKPFELIPNLMIRLISAEAVESIETPDEGNPYNEIYSEKGRFLMLHLEAWREGEVENGLPLMMSINVLGWADEVLKNKNLISTMEASLGKLFLAPESVEESKKEFFLCFPTEGASLGWMVNVYREIDGQLLLGMTVDTGQ